MPDWPEIIEREGGAVWRTAYRLLGNRADADECFQEAFLAALEVSRREPVRDWGALLCRLAAARAVDRLRRRYRRREDGSVADWDALTGSAPLPSQGAEDAERAESLRAALAGLPPNQAEALCLHHLEDWSYRQIAGHLAISVDAVGVLLHRARRRLRELLESSASAEVPRVAGRGPAPCPGPASLPEEPR
jgi:RNA polymerase sigma-70 factor, ECF subfamily